MNRDKCKRALFLCVKYLVSAAVVAVVVGPLLVTLFTSVKTQAQLASTSPILRAAGGVRWRRAGPVFSPMCTA